MAKKKGFTYKHWFALSLITIILAGIIAGVVAFVILGKPEIRINTSPDIIQPIQGGENEIDPNLDCEDPRKYPHPEYGCICKEDYKTSTNFRGTFCLEKGRQFSYWPE